MAGMVIDEVATCPRGRFDDLADTTSMAVYHLRSYGCLERVGEQFIRKEEMGRNYRQPKPLYNI